MLKKSQSKKLTRTVHKLHTGLNIKKRFHSKLDAVQNFFSGLSAKVSVNIRDEMIELNIKGEIRRKTVGISLDNFNYSTQLIICIVAIFSLYIGYGYCQEWIFQIEILKKAGMFITLIQFFFYTVFGLLEKSCNQIVGRKDSTRMLVIQSPLSIIAIPLLHSGTQKRGSRATYEVEPDSEQAADDDKRMTNDQQSNKYHTTRDITPMKSYYVLSLLTIATMGLSNASLGYLNYPTQVIFKSSKLIPVMIGGIIIQGKRYGFLDVTSCVLMTAGVISFTAADFTVLPSFDPIGILLISGALCADAAIGNYQELCLKKYKSSNAEMVLYSYGIGFFLLLIWNLLFQPNLVNLIIFVLSNSQVLAMIFFFSLSGYIGILFVLHLVRTFGALLAVTVTTCRKALTIVLSFVFFRKPFTLWYIFAGFLVVCGIFANVYSKQRKQRKEQRTLPM